MLLWKARMATGLLLLWTASTDPAAASPIGDPHPGGEPVLQTILDDLTSGAVDAETDQILLETYSGSGLVEFQIVAEHAFFAPMNRLGIYSLTDSSLELLIFHGGDATGSLSSVTFNADGSVTQIGSSGVHNVPGFGSEYGIYLERTSEVTFFSQAALNGGDVHQLVYALNASAAVPQGRRLWRVRPCSLGKIWHSTDRKRTSTTRTWWYGSGIWLPRSRPSRAPLR